MTRLARIEDIAEVNPRLPKVASTDPHQRVSFLPMSGLSEEGHIAELGERPLSDVAKGYKHFRAGDVLLAKITPCFENGKAAVVGSLPGDLGFGSTEFHVLRPSDQVDGRYLFHMIWNPAFRFVGERNMTGTAGQKRVPTDFLKRYRIPLPPLAEQHRIAAILDKADGIQRKRRESIELLEEFLRSAFFEMFGDPVRNPKRWEVVSLKDISEVQGGLQVTSARSKHEIEVPYLRVANVYRDRLDLSEVKSLRVTVRELEGVALQEGDVLVVEGHGNPNEIGRSAIWDASVQPCLHQNHLIRVRLDRDAADPVFVSSFLNSSGGRRQMFKFGKTTSGLNTISTSDVKRVRVTLPPLAEQQRYVEVQRRVSVLQRRFESGVDEGDQLFDSLAQRAFGGELGGAR